MSVILSIAIAFETELYARSPVFGEHNNVSKRNEKAMFDFYKKLESIGVSLEHTSFGSDNVEFYLFPHHFEQLKEAGIPFELLTHPAIQSQLDSSIENQPGLILEKRSAKRGGKDSQYHSYSDMFTKLRKIVDDNPNMSRLFSTGKSVQDRHLYGVRLHAGIADCESVSRVEWWLSEKKEWAVCKK